MIFEGIILVLNLIKISNRINGILDEVDERVAKFDRIFKVTDVITDNMALVSDKLVDGISELIRKVFSRKKRKEEIEDE